MNLKITNHSFHQLVLNGVTEAPITLMKNDSVEIPENKLIAGYKKVTTVFDSNDLEIVEVSDKPLKPAKEEGSEKGSEEGTEEKAGELGQEKNTKKKAKNKDN